MCVCACVCLFCLVYVFVLALSYKTLHSRRRRRRRIYNVKQKEREGRHTHTLAIALSHRLFSLPSYSPSPLLYAHTRTQRLPTDLHTAHKTSQQANKQRTAKQSNIYTHTQTYFTRLIRHLLFQVCLFEKKERHL